MRIPSESWARGGSLAPAQLQRKLRRIKPSTTGFRFPSGRMMAINMPKSITEQPLTAHSGRLCPSSTPTTVPQLQPGRAAHMAP